MGQSQSVVINEYFGQELPDCLSLEIQSCSHAFRPERLNARELKIQIDDHAVDLTGASVLRSLEIVGDESNNVIVITNDSVERATLSHGHFVIKDCPNLRCLTLVNAFAEYHNDADLILSLDSSPMTSSLQPHVEGLKLMSDIEVDFTKMPKLQSFEGRYHGKLISKLPRLIRSLTLHTSENEISIPLPLLELTIRSSSKRFCLTADRHINRCNITAGECESLSINGNFDVLNIKAKSLGEYERKGIIRGEVRMNVW